MGKKATRSRDEYVILRVVNPSPMHDFSLQNPLKCHENGAKVNAGEDLEGNPSLIDPFSALPLLS